MKILLIGPQGSGKSTQAELLSEYLKIPVISTGDIFRDLSQDHSEQGRMIKKILEEGSLVDNQTTSKIVEDRVKQSDCKNGFIVDGYPRTLDQIKFFDPDFNKVFYLQLSDEDAIARLLKRGRDDDTQEAVAWRLKHYHILTDPIIDYYLKRGLLTTIDGSGTIEEIQTSLRKAVNE